MSGRCRKRKLVKCELNDDGGVIQEKKQKKRRPPRKTAEGWRYRVVKTGLAGVVRDAATAQKLNDLACRVHHIRVHAFQFLKAYLCHLTTTTTNDNVNLADCLSQSFVVEVLKQVCEANSQSNKQRGKGGMPLKPETVEIRRRLSAYFETYYRPLLYYSFGRKEFECSPSSENLCQIFQYMSKEIITAYENNIREHFADHVGQLVNVVWQRRQMLRALEGQKAAKLAFLSELKQVKKDLLIIQRPNTNNTAIAAFKS